MAFVAPPPAAAEISITATADCYVTLSGPIEAADSARFAPFADRATWLPEGPVQNLCLDSVGGSYEEAIAIAEMVYRNGIATYVAADQECIGPCALIWLAGNQWLEGHLVWRKLHILGRLGFGAPVADPLPAGAYPASDVAAAYDEGVAAIGRIVALPLVNQGHNEPIVPVDLLAEMLLQPPGEVVMVDIGRALEWGIDLVGAAPAAAPTSAGLCNVCFNAAGLRWGYQPPYICADAVETSRTSERVRAVFPGFGSSEAGELFCAVEAELESGLVTRIRTGLNDAPSLPEHASILSPTMLYAPDAPTSSLTSPAP